MYGLLFDEPESVLDPFASSQLRDTTPRFRHDNPALQHISKLHLLFFIGMLASFSAIAGLAYATRPAGMSGTTAAYEIVIGMRRPLLLLLTCGLGYALFSVARLRCRWIMTIALPSLMTGMLFPFIALGMYAIDYSLFGYGYAYIAQLPAMVVVTFILSEFALVRRVKACGTTCGGDHKDT